MKKQRLLLRQTPKVLGGLSALAAGKALALDDAAISQDGQTFNVVPGATWQQNQDGTVTVITQDGSRTTLNPDQFIIQDGYIFVTQDAYDVVNGLLTNPWFWTATGGASFGAGVVGGLILGPNGDDGTSNVLLPAGVLCFKDDIVPKGVSLATLLPGSNLTYSIVSGTLPAGLTLNSATGAITGLPALADPLTASSQVVRFQAEDADGNILQMDVTVAVALNVTDDDVSITDRFEANGGDKDDIVNLGDDYARQGGFIALNMGEGDNIISFGDNAAETESEIQIRFGDGENVVMFGRDAAADAGVISIVGGDGNNILNFGPSAAETKGFIDVKLGDGDNRLTFGDDAAVEEAGIGLTTGSGDDNFRFGFFAAASSGYICIDAGDGDNQIGFDPAAGLDGGAVCVYSGDGEDVVLFDGGAAVDNGFILVSTGGGDDRIEFGVDAAFLNGSISVAPGEGADRIFFDDDAGITGSISIVLSTDETTTVPDGSADIIEFAGAASNVSIAFMDSGDTIKFGGVVNAANAGGNVSLTAFGVNVTLLGTTTGMLVSAAPASTFTIA